MTHGDKLHQVFQRTRSELDNIMSGYILPDPYFEQKALVTVERLMSCLKDPCLPLLELQVCEKRDMHIVVDGLAHMPTSSMSYACTLNCALIFMTRLFFFFG